MPEFIPTTFRLVGRKSSGIRFSAPPLVHKEGGYFEKAIRILEICGQSVCARYNHDLDQGSSSKKADIIK